jgi:methyl-accepting chemotaxis protein
MLVEIKASAISTIMLDPTLKETRDVFTDAERNIAALQNKVSSAIKRPGIRDEFQKIIVSWSQYDKDSQQLISLASRDAKLANEGLVPLYNAQFKPFQSALEAFVANRLVDATNARDEARSISARVYWTVIPLMAIVAVVVIVLVMFVSSSLQSGLKGILQKLGSLRQGDLTERLPVTGNDELGQIASGVNGFVAEMQGIVRNVHGSASELSSAALQLNGIARQVANSSASQSDSAASTAAAIEQMSVSVASIADTTGEVRELSNASLDDAIKGSQSTAELQQEIAKVRADVNAIANHVREFVGNTNSIAGMTQQIREIADQTNLLALNAAIEAARAGEQGRGFAVVADEVRKLAERASLSSGQITAVTQELNVKSAMVDQSIEGGLNSLSASLDFVNNLSLVLSHTSQSVQKTSSGIHQVTASVQEQKAASAEIARNVEVIAQMADNNRSASQESAEASARLAQLAMSLKGAIDRFKV